MILTKIFGLQDVDKYAPETEVHKYLHSRLACFDIATLYELHYQMITLGKVRLLQCCLKVCITAIYTAHLLHAGMHGSTTRDYL